MDKSGSNLTAYLPFEGLESELQKELGGLHPQYGSLFVDSGSPREALWAQDIWRDCEILQIESISDAVKKLKARKKFWALHSWNWHRRATLIQEGLPRLKAPLLEFMKPIDIPEFGSWTLLEPNKILLSAQPHSRRPLGDYSFVEDKVTPPSRAYLKLWELFTVHSICPPRGAHVIDVGSSPGGWTWVLQQVGCKVTSVDKAPLDSRIAKLPGVHSLKKDAFKMAPPDVPGVEWLFSDIICYPQKLLEYLKPWIESPVNLVCTIKFQGETDYQALKAFSEVPQSRIVHLFHNKHEVTWIRLHARS